MEAHEDISRNPARGRSLRTRIIFFCLLPALIGGLTYYLLVEFVLRESLRLESTPPLLRYGGIAVVVLSALIALGFGLLLADGVTRPLRTLRRVAEGSEEDLDLIGSSISSDPELSRLFLRVHTLAQQNRAGAQALRELHALQGETIAVTEDLRRATELSFLPASISGRALNGSPGKLSAGLEKFIGSLRGELAALDEALRDLSRRLDGDGARSEDRNKAIEVAIREVERLGSIWSLELEMARRYAPQMPGELGSNFRGFVSAVEQVRRAAEGQGNGETSLADLRTDVARLHETLTAWLRPEGTTTPAGRPSDSMGGTSE